METVPGFGSDPAGLRRLEPGLFDEHYLGCSHNEDGLAGPLAGTDSRLH